MATVHRGRVLARNIGRGDTFSFDVTPAMFDFKEARFEAPVDSELASCVVVDSR